MAEQDKNSSMERLLRGIGQIDEDLIALEEPGAPRKIQEKRKEEEKTSGRFRMQYFIGFAAAALILAVVIPIVMSHRHLQTMQVADSTAAVTASQADTGEAVTAAAADAAASDADAAIAPAAEVTGLAEAEEAAGITFQAPSPAEIAGLSDSGALTTVTAAAAEGSGDTIIVTYQDAEGNTILTVEKTDTKKTVGSRAVKESASDTVHGWTVDGASYHTEAADSTVTLRDLTRVRDLIETDEAKAQ